MANKKISQLNSVDPSVGIGTESVFPMVSGTSSSNYQTSKVTSVDIAKFVLNPIPVGQAGMESIGFTGAANVYFDKSNWVDTSNAGTHAFVMVNKVDGQLTTGSGIGVVAGGDNMGDCKATTNVNMQNNFINNIDSLYFKSTINNAIEDDGFDLLVKAGQDLTVSGIRHVSISGQALDLASTPISGDVTFMKGGLTIPDNQGLTGDNIVINKTSRHLPHNNGASLIVNWANSNIQFDARAQGAPAPNYTFSNALAGQTLTMYVDNNHNATVIPSFTSGSTVKWGGPSGGPPHLVTLRTNVYTFVCYDGVIFASAITGYAY